MTFREKISRWILTRGLRSVRVLEWDGIEVACLLDNEERFKDLIKKCLLLIKNLDRRRYLRVKRHVKWIVGSRMISLNSGRFSSSTGLCMLNPTLNTVDEKNVAQQAGIIIHEATHGLLDNCGFPYNRDTRVQIERICSAEEIRFLSRLPEELADELTFRFNADSWTEYWNTPKWRQLINELYRVL